MAKPQVIGAALVMASALAASALGGAAFAQAAAPIANRDVVGDWRLVIMPSERQDLKVTFKSRDGAQQLDFPLTITDRDNGRLACVVDDGPADCRIRDGRLVVVSAGGGVRLTFTLAERTRGGFGGTASLRVRLLPIGGEIGSVNMTRR